MDTERGQYKAYLVRLWQAGSSEASPWRASIEDARTGARYRFATLDMLFTFFESETLASRLSTYAQGDRDEHHQQEQEDGMTATMQTIDQTKLQAFVGQVVTDVAATFSAGLVVIGEQLGLYKTMAGAGPLSSGELASRTGLSERYVREWLGNQVASGYVTYDPTTQCYLLPDEHALVLADDSSPVYLPGAFYLAASTLQDEPQISQAFRTGEGVGWHEHNHGVFEGVKRLFRPSYTAFLTTTWIPALSGVEAKLKAGAHVADVGCGLGASTIIMAQAYPNSTFIGFDYHDASIMEARNAAHAAGISDRVTFEIASAKNYPGHGYDLVTFFDCLHDMGDPVGAARHVRQSLAADGTWMIVEPFANDRLEDNINPVGRTYYAASTMLCTPSSLAQETGLALGAQAGEARLREVVTQGGFRRFHRATETPFHLVLEARP
jgi:2-polyprenyl-3-methyl-5-hydroxy-6-metoxy-1,4-benzoquinol methylase